MVSTYFLFQNMTFFTNIFLINKIFLMSFVDNSYKVRLYSIQQDIKIHYRTEKYDIRTSLGKEVWVGEKISHNENTVLFISN